MAKKNKKNFIGNSKNVIWALLIVAAAVTVYGIAQAATVSHTPSEITPQGSGSGFDSDYLQGLSSADILSAGGSGGYNECYSIDATNTYDDDGNFLSSGNLDCASDYTTIISSKGDGCQETHWKAVNIGGSEWMRVEIEFSGYPSYIRSENLYVVSGGVKFKLASKTCSQSGYQYASTLAICCK